MIVVAAVGTTVPLLDMDLPANIVLVRIFSAKNILLLKKKK